MDWQTFLMEQTKDKTWMPHVRWETSLRPGMVFRVPGIKGGRQAPDGKEYLLVGNINASAGTCSCCDQNLEGAEYCTLLGE